jgi:hypothetical protein
MNELKRKHIKSAYLNSSSFKTAEYLEDGRFSRSQTTDLKINVPKMSTDNLCSI